MKPARSALLVMVSSVGLAACSLLLNFGEEGQACDPSGRCLAGYACVDNVCRPSPGGTGGCPTACGTGERCLVGSGQCVADVCANRLCPVGTRCTDSGGGTACVPLPPPELGSACATDGDCDAGVGARFCFVGAIPAASGGARIGFCAERCGATDAGVPTCATSGASCSTYVLGLDAGRVPLCMPFNLVTACTGDDLCRSEGFACTVYDNPTLGPIGLCDAPLANGAATGAPCGSGGASCANGLCVARTGAGGGTTCGELCATGTCGGGEHCALVGFSASGGGATRQLPICVP